MLPAATWRLAAPMVDKPFTDESGINKTYYAVDTLGGFVPEHVSLRSQDWNPDSPG